MFFGFLSVFGGVFVCGCLAFYGSEELFFGSFREWMVGWDWMALFLIPLFFTSPLTKNPEKSMICIS